VFISPLYLLFSLRTSTALPISHGWIFTGAAVLLTLPDNALSGAWRGDLRAARRWTFFCCHLYMNATVAALSAVYSLATAIFRRGHEPAAA